MAVLFGNQFAVTAAARAGTNSGVAGADRGCCGEAIKFLGGQLQCFTGVLTEEHLEAWCGESLPDGGGDSQRLGSRLGNLRPARDLADQVREGRPGIMKNSPFLL